MDFNTASASSFSSARANGTRILVEPTLHITGLKEGVPDERILEAFQECLRIRPRIQRPTGDPNAPATGTIEFESFDRAEKAFATVNGMTLRDYGCTIQLRGSANPQPSAHPRMFKSMPLSTTAGDVFDLCRRFGPVFHVAMGQITEGVVLMKGQAMVTFLNEADAATATSELHCSVLGGQTIIVQKFDSARTRAPELATPPAQSSPVALSPTASRWAPSAAAPSFSPKPAVASRPSLNSSATPFKPPASPGPFGLSRSTRSHSFTSQTSAQSVATTAAPVEDPCNLFVKSLDPKIDTRGLIDLFRPYGTIKSARVMSDPDTRVSKEFGFVAFEKPEQAAAAMAAMDGAKIGTNTIVVRFHESKATREAKLAQEALALSKAKNDLQALDIGGTSAAQPTTAGSFADQRASATVETKQPESAVEQEAQDPWSTPAPWAKPAAPQTVAPEPERPAAPIKAAPAPASVPVPEEPFSHSTPADAVEAERIKQAVHALGPPQADEIVNLLIRLPKKYRAMCLISTDYMRESCFDALAVFHETEQMRRQEAASKTQEPVRSSVAQAQNGSGDNTREDVGDRNGSARSEAVDDEEEEEEEDSLNFVSELAEYPVLRIMALESRFPELGIEIVSQEKRRERDAFMDANNGLRLQAVKQSLGEVLFKAVRATGDKYASKKTIHLLDTEDLRSLAHLIDYPAILKEVVARVPDPKK